MAEAEQKFDKFHPPMPRIPGVTDGQGEPPKPEETGQRKLIPWLIAAVAAFLLIGGTIAWRMLRSVPEASGNAAELAARPEPNRGAAIAHPPALRLPAEIANLSELASPWSSKKFHIRNPRTNEDVPAIVVRLPGGANRTASYWAFSLRAPFGHCELEYLAELSTLATKYSYRAAHPMVGNPCTGTVYDPLRLGTLPSGAWARGEIVYGSGFRPPTAIEVRINGSRLVASQIE